MITLLNRSGAMNYAEARQTPFPKVLSRTEVRRTQWVDVRLGADYVDQFVR
jgi:hypothetical protein